MEMTETGRCPLAICFCINPTNHVVKVLIGLRTGPWPLKGWVMETDMRVWTGSWRPACDRGPRGSAHRLRSGERRRDARLLCARGPLALFRACFRAGVLGGCGVWMAHRSLAFHADRGDLGRRGAATLHAQARGRVIGWDNRASVRFGLDFGTSNTSVAVWDGDRSTVLPIDPLAGAAMPTVLYVRRDGSSIVGRPAIDAYLADNRERGPITREYRPLGIRMESSNPRQKTVEAQIFTDISSPGRLFQALKTFLGDALDISTNVFGEERGLEDLIAVVLAHVRS